MEGFLVSSRLGKRLIGGFKSLLDRSVSQEAPSRPTRFSGQAEWAGGDPTDQENA